MYAIIFGGKLLLLEEYFQNQKKLLESLRGLEIEILVVNNSGIKNITITIPIYIITFTVCDSKQKLF